MSKKTTKSVEKMTLEEFFESEKRTAIHCKTKEQSEILLKAFDEMGKTWRNGGSYVEKSEWEVYEKDTCYDNTGFFTNKGFYLFEKNKVVEFDDIEFEPKKKLTAEEITKWILENCVDKNGIVNLKGLDFGNKNVDISFLKTTGNLYQDSQKVGGNLYQDSQKVGGVLHQSCQKVDGDLYQNNQEVAKNLYQDSQKVDGNLYSHKLEQNEVWEEHSMNVVRKKVLKPITRKELAETGFEIKD